jgi:hypothetical protein
VLPRECRGGFVRVIGYDDAVLAARAQFLRGTPLQLGDLAEDLAVSRATLYRVLGSQDRLLGDVIWSLTESTLDLAVRAAAGATGTERILLISHRFEAAIRRFPALQRWVQEDPLQASRVLFTPAGAVHERVVRAWGSIFAVATARGELTLPCAAEQFAYLYVRMGETALYGELIAGIKPDPITAERLRRTMLTGLPSLQDS